MENNPNTGDLRVWWIPQIPMQAFYVPVKSIREAKLVLDSLTRYDLFQLDKHIKPDFCNAGGLETYETDVDGEGNPGWREWYNDEGVDIDNVDDDGNTLEEDDD